MKNDSSTTNYLAAATSSKYDALQRQVSALIQHWMDHTSKVKVSKVIPTLCTFIESAELPHFQCKAEDIFSTKDDYFLGKIIQFFIEIQDGQLKEEELLEKRQEIEKILNQFSILNHTSSNASETRLQNINNSSEDNLEKAPLESDTQPDKRWWLKFLDLFSKQK